MNATAKKKAVSQAGVNSPSIIQKLLDEHKNVVDKIKTDAYTLGYQAGRNDERRDSTYYFHLEADAAEELLNFVEHQFISAAESPFLIATIRDLRRFVSPDLDTQRTISFDKEPEDVLV